MIGVVGLKELRKAIEDVNRHGQSAGSRDEEASEGLKQVKTEKYDNTETVTSIESMAPSSLLSNESKDNLMD